MRAFRSKLLGFGLLAAIGCDESADTSGAQNSLQWSDSEFVGVDASAGDAGRSEERGPGKGDAGAGRDSDAGALRLADGGTPVVNLTCPRGGDSAPVGVLFACDRITVVTCKDLSNVVIEFADGSRQRVQGLNGHQNVFVSPAGATVVGVWVKAGENPSGDGPGYGQRFDAPAGTCADGGTGTPPTPPSPPAQNPPSDPPPTQPPQNPPSDPPPPSNPPTPPDDSPGWVD